MSIVSNASPLINLARINKLDLLRDLYQHVIVPEAVWTEVVIEGMGQPGAEEVKGAAWIKKQVVSNPSLVQALKLELDEGEAEAIALGLELKAEFLLMDERLGRESARHLGLRCIGLVGILIESKHKGLIQNVKPCVDALRDLAGFRLSGDLYLRVLQDEGEI